MAIKLNSNFVRICIALTALSTLAGCAGRGDTSAFDGTAPAGVIAVSAASTDGASSAEAAIAAQTVAWPGIDYAAYRSDKPDLGGSDIDSNTITIGQQDGVFSFALLHLPLGGDFMPNELTETKLFLKVLSGQAPDMVKISLASRNWVPNYMMQDEVKGLVYQDSLITVPVTVEADNWVSIPLTPEVESWLAGIVANNGFLLTSDGPGTFTFATGNDVAADTPYVSAAGVIGPRDLSYGQFGYTEVAGPDDVESANCLAYALRHLTPIYIEEMGTSKDALRAAYHAGGLQAQTELTAQTLESYVNSHKAELAIDNFRRLDSFDAPIDPATEYRIALRGGIVGYTDDDPDYHFWAQLNDGRWAGKYPWANSGIMVGTAGNLSPDDYQWDGGWMWGYDRTVNQYTSDVIYFAVTKTAPDFTS